MEVSKSDYMDFLKHPALLWLKKNEPDKLFSFDAPTQRRLEAGYEFEEYAQQLFPEAIKIGFNSPDEYRSMHSRTAHAWANGATCVTQGMYKSGALTCITDILEFDNGYYTLTEIKNGNSIKSNYIMDLAFQKLILEEIGYNIGKCQILHANKDYVRDGQIAPALLTCINDVTHEVQKNIAITKLNAAKALQIIESKNIPDLDPLLAKAHSFTEWLSIRKTIEPRLPLRSIYYLPKISYKIARKLKDHNIEKIDDINDLSILSHGTAKYWKAHLNDGRYINFHKLKKFLNTIKYPVYYLDYETISNAVPMWDKTWPHQQIPFQYSLHIKQDQNAKIEHFEYLHENIDCPVEKLLVRLSNQIKCGGTILVWNQSFEKKRNEEMAALRPKYAKFLSTVNDRVIDLMKPFSDDVIMDPEFLGSNSIKDVLPVIIPEFSYKDLEIKDGGTAAGEWYRVTFKNQTNKSQIYENLRQYCKRDIKASVSSVLGASSRVSWMTFFSGPPQPADAPVSLQRI